MKLFLVQQEGAGERLIEAPNAVRAIKFYCADLVQATVATPQDIHRLAKEGVEIERADEGNA